MLNPLGSMVGLSPLPMVSFRLLSQDAGWQAPDSHLAAGDRVQAGTRVSAQQRWQVVLYIEQSYRSGEGGHEICFSERLSRASINHSSLRPICGRLCDKMSATAHATGLRGLHGLKPNPSQHGKAIYPPTTADARIDSIIDEPWCVEGDGCPGPIVNRTGHSRNRGAFFFWKPAEGNVVEKAAECFTATVEPPNESFLSRWTD
jgi:hypothetical protein